MVAEFDGGMLTSDAGGLLLGAADRGLGLVRRLAECFRDARDPRPPRRVLAPAQKPLQFVALAWG